ncbi:MAG: hypothetical protein RIC80_19010 [Cyclobacteriaceae bacterium]
MKMVIKTAIFTFLMAIGLEGVTKVVTSGVYMTYEDYLNVEMEYAINCFEESHKLRPHGTFVGEKFEVSHRGEKFTHEQSKIFGYRDCDGKDWRYLGRYEYQIAETRSLIVYKRYQTSNNDPIPVQTNPWYYYSVNNGDVLELTVTNLKETIPEAHDFHNKLDETFNGDEDLSSYDYDHKMYKLNRFLLSPVTSATTIVIIDGVELNSYRKSYACGSKGLLGIFKTILLSSDSRG